MNDTYAYPFVHKGEKGENIYNNGMTLRDWFAGQALAGMMANCDTDGVNGWTGPGEAAAMVAYVFADAMLKERAK